MTAVPSVQQYLSDHPQGDATEWRHTIDPLDYDNSPFQHLAPGYTDTPQEPQNGTSGLPGTGAALGVHPAIGGPADAASAVPTGVLL